MHLEDLVSYFSSFSFTCWWRGRSCACSTSTQFLVQSGCSIYSVPDPWVMRASFAASLGAA